MDHPIPTYIAEGVPTKWQMDLRLVNRAQHGDTVYVRILEAGRKVVVKDEMSPSVCVSSRTAC